MPKPVLYDYYRSTASYRVRIALNLAGIDYDKVNVNLLDKEHRGEEHLSRNPQGKVPVLDIDGQRFTQSIAIMEYLNETRELGLLPDGPIERAKARAIVQAIAADIHPVCNLSVMLYATGGEEPARTEWMRHFIEPGLVAVEALLAGFEQLPFALGNKLTMVDICIIAQIYNADRWGADYSNCPRIKAIVAACGQIEAFMSAKPE